MKSYIYLFLLAVAYADRDFEVVNGGTNTVSDGSTLTDEEI